MKYSQKRYLHIMSQTWVLAFVVSYALSQVITIAQVTRITTVDRPQWPMVTWPNLTKVEPVEIEPETPIDLRIRGSGLTPNTKVAFTWVPGTRGSLCNTSELLSPTFGLSRADHLTANVADLKIKLKGTHLTNGDVETAYVCILDSPEANQVASKWVHQGDKVKIRVISNTLDEHSKIHVYGVRGEGNDRIYLAVDGTTVIPADQLLTLRLTGHAFVPGMLVAVTRSRRKRGSDCDDLPKTSVHTLTGPSVMSKEVAIV